MFFLFSLAMWGGHILKHMTKKHRSDLNRKLATGVVVMAARIV